MTPHGTGSEERVRASCTITKNKSAIQNQLQVLTKEHSVFSNFLLKKSANCMIIMHPRSKTAAIDCVSIDWAYRRMIQ